MYLTSLASSYDPHTNYMSADTLEEFNISMRLHLEGIGARLRSEDGITVVAEVLSGGPASRDGRLKPEDKILAVAQDDGHFEDVVDRKLPDVVKLIRGARGTQVMLRVVPAGKTEPQVYVLKRDRIDIKSQEARGEVVEQGKRADGKPYRIGWIDLDSFYLDVAAANSGKADAKSTTKDVRVILEKFKQQNVDGVVLDLRDNGGGALTEAIKLVGLFIDRGPVVQVKNFQGSVSDYPDNERGTVYDGPLTVLVSRFSASASEIVAGAIHDYERGLVVGDSHTHGKGTVQTVLDIGQHADDNGPNLGALKLTIQQFFRINGESTQNQGVDADIVLPSVYDHMEIGEKFLKNALPASKVRKVSHERLGRVNPDILEQLRKGSEKRRETSPDFKKLAGTIEVVNRRREQKAITLNEAQYRKEVEGGPDGDPAEGPEAAHPPEATDKPGAPVIKRTYYTNEVLDIMTDYIRLSGSLHTAAKI
jgi:carboxyl-terminal processing protease